MLIREPTAIRSRAMRHHSPFISPCTNFVSCTPSRLAPRCPRCPHPRRLRPRRRAHAFTLILTSAFSPSASASSVPSSPHAASSASWTPFPSAETNRGIKRSPCQFKDAEEQHRGRQRLPWHQSSKHRLAADERWSLSGTTFSWFGCLLYDDPLLND